MRATTHRPARPRTVAAPGDRTSRLASGRGLRVCLTSAPARAAARIARLLVDRRVAACVSELPAVRSTYRWKGGLERSREVLLVIKTTRASLARCVALLAAEHPYEVPEILVATPGWASAAYGEWVHAETAWVSA